MPEKGVRKGQSRTIAPRTGFPAPRNTPPIAPDSPSESWKAATSGSTFATSLIISGSEEKREPHLLRSKTRRIELTPEQTIAIAMVRREVTRARWGLCAPSKSVSRRSRLDQHLGALGFE